jgi:tetratricopeptide (TPR) repeat protein
VAGFDIPARYFQFVRTGNASPLAAVLEHNRLDLLALAALTARLFGLARTGPESTRDPREALALGRVYARAGLETRARSAFERALALSRAPAGAYDPVTIETLRALAMTYRRAREFDAAARCWQRLLETRGCPEPIVREASEALAIHNEHRRRDLATARSFALRNLEHAERGMRPAWTQAVQHRLSRLDRKLERERLLEESSRLF